MTSGELMVGSEKLIPKNILMLKHITELKELLSINNLVSKHEWSKEGIASNRLESGFNLSTNESISNLRLEMIHRTDLMEFRPISFSLTLGYWSLV